MTTENLLIIDNNEISKTKKTAHFQNMIKCKNYSSGTAFEKSCPPKT